MQLLILAACGLVLGASVAAADPQGLWLVEDKSAQIEIKNCDGALWGVVVWERAPGLAEPPDARHSDPARHAAAEPGGGARDGVARTHL